MQSRLAGPDPPWRSRWHTALSLAAVGGGVVSFLGWALDVPRLTDWNGDGISMQPNATVLLTLAGASLLLQTRARKLALALGGFVAVAGAVLLLQHFVSVDFGIHRPLTFGRTWGQQTTVTPGRVGPPASMAFMLIGIALVLAARRGGDEPARERRWVPLLGIAVGVIVLFSLVGYLFGARQFYAIPWLSAIALQTSVLLLAIGFALVLGVPEHEPMRMLLARSATSTMAWRFLPVLIVLPPVVMWLGLRGAELGLYDAGTGRTLRVMCIVVASVALMWWSLRAAAAQDEARRRDERALQRSQAEVASMFAASGVGMAQADPSTRRFLRVNPALCTMTGYSEAELLGMTVDQLNHPDDRERDRHVYEQLAHGGARYAVEKRYLTKHGRTLWVLVSADMTRDVDGKSLLAFAVVQDITERRLAEDETRRSRQLLAELIERAPFGIYIVDAQFRIAHMNAGSQNGAFRNVRPVIGRDFAEAMHILWDDAVAEPIIAAFRHTLQTGEPYQSPGLTEARRDIGAVESYEWELHRVTLPDGQFAVVCYYFDSTRLQQAQAALREADRRKDEFLATLAHELRNPLAPLLNAVHLLKLGDADPGRAARTGELIERQVRQMTRLIDDLLDISRISLGKITLKRSCVALADVLRAAVELSRPLVEQAGQTLSIEVPERSLYLDADIARLAQVFGNLLHNAVKYSERGARIVLKAEAQGDEVAVTVQDSGVGIPADKLEQVFELFAQVDQSLERSQGGLGIGLTLVKRLVELHGGRVEAHSEGPGTGSRFVVRLPLASAPVAELDPRDAAAGAAPARRILIVDDNRDAADTLAALMGLLGNETRVARDGVEALRMAAEFRPEVVLLDLGLPKINGYDVARAIRREPWGDDVVLMAVSGWGTDADRRRSSDAGIDRHLVKPLAPDVLIEQLATMVPRRGALRA